MAEQISFADEGEELDPTNVQPRCACVLVIDTSSSMGGDPITEVNQGLRAFHDEIKDDPVARERVDIAIVTFGPVQIEQGFQSVENFTPPALSPSGNTPMGEAVLRALEMLRHRKDLYRKEGVPYYRPWCMLVTDGAPNHDDPWHEAADAVQALEREKSIVFFPIGVRTANMDVLGEFSGQRQPLLLKGLNFRELFLWLSASLGQVSRSGPADEVQLPPTGWASI
jgi:uncharacterized protein YegL